MNAVIAGGMPVPDNLVPLPLVSRRHVDLLRVSSALCPRISPVG